MAAGYFKSPGLVRVICIKEQSEYSFCFSRLAHTDRISVLIDRQADSDIVSVSLVRCRSSVVHQVGHL